MVDVQPQFEQLEAPRSRQTFLFGQLDPSTEMETELSEPSTSSGPRLAGLPPTGLFPPGPHP